jgi:hypothetical protein
MTKEQSEKMAVMLLNYGWHRGSCPEQQDSISDKCTCGWSRCVRELRALPSEPEVPLPLGFVRIAQCASCGVNDVEYAKHFAFCAAAPGQPVRSVQNREVPK